MTRARAPSDAEVSRKQSMKTVWIYIDTNKQVGDPNHLHVFASQDTARAWLNEFEPKGEVFEYPVFGREAGN